MAAADKTCQARTKKGSLCSRPAVKEGYCLQHYDMLNTFSSLQLLKEHETEHDKMVYESMKKLNKEAKENVPDLPYIEDLDKEYKLEETIGYGSFGEILKYSKDGQTIAVKKFMDPITWRLELENLRMVNSSYVIKLLFIGDKIIGIEYSSGQKLRDLIFRYRERKIELAMDLQKSIIYQIALGIKDMQAVKLAHCDLNPDNIMIDKLGNVKIIDLGSAELLNERRFNIVSTFNYREINLYRDSKVEYIYATEKTDIWSIGVIILVINSDKYNDEYRATIKDNPKQKDIINVVEKVKTDKIKEYDNPLCQFALTRMLVPDRDKRANIQEVIDFVSKS